MLTLVWQVDPSSLLETDWIRYFIGLGGHPTIEVVDLHHQWVGPGAIVITRGETCDAVTTKAYLRRFAEAGHRVGVVHVGDEFSRSPVDFYEDAAFVYRQCERPGVSWRPNVHFLPVGFKNGLLERLESKPMAERRYLWSFAGFVRGRVSRRSMVRHAKRIPGGLLALGQSFNDSSRVSFDAYVKVLGDTKFCLAPGGNRIVESFRVYEAILSGAVPVVEVLTRRKILGMIARDVLSPARMRTYGTWSVRYWTEMAYWWRHPDLWERAFGPNFPCPRVKHWSELEHVLSRIDPVACAQAVKQFWTAYESRAGASLAELMSQYLLHPLAAASSKPAIDSPLQLPISLGLQLAESIPGPTAQV